MYSNDDDDDALIRFGSVPCRRKQNASTVYEQVVVVVCSSDTFRGMARGETIRELYGYALLQWRGRQCNATQSKSGSYRYN
jgi:hypothetical protein